jgi:hypothetical protein
VKKGIKKQVRAEKTPAYPEWGRGRGCGVGILGKISEPTIRAL